MVYDAALSVHLDETAEGFDAFFLPFLSVVDQGILATDLPPHLHEATRAMALTALRDLLLPVASAAFMPRVLRPRGSLSALAAHLGGQPSRDHYRAFLADGGVSTTWRGRTVFTDMGITVSWHLVQAVAEAIDRARSSRQVGAPTREVRLLSSDRHRGRTVLRVDGPDGSAAYRPRDSAIAAAVHGWLRSLNVVGIHALQVEAFDGHGFVEWASGGGDPVLHARGLGAWWVLLRALDARDIHFENIVVSDRGVGVIDLEVLGGSWRPIEPSLTSWPASVSATPDLTMMIPSWTWTREGTLTDLSLLAGSMARVSSVPVPLVQSPGTDAARLVFVPRPVEVSNGTLPWTSADAVSAFEAGADDMQKLLTDAAVVGDLAQRLKGCRTRVLVRDTILYSQVLWRAMLDPAVKDRGDAIAAFGELGRLPTRDGSEPAPEIVQAEMASLLDGDIPYFEAPLASAGLPWAVPGPAQRSAVSAVLRVPRNRRPMTAHQSVSGSAVDRAVRALASSAVEFDDGSVGWLASRWTTAKGFTTAPIEWGLFEGHVGIAVALVVTMRAGLLADRGLLDRAIARLRELPPDDVIESKGLGLSDGLAGVALGLSSVLADVPDLEPVVDHALTVLERRVTSAVRQTAWDFDDGAAGVIWALQLLGIDVPDLWWEALPSSTSLRGLAHGDAGVALVTGAAPLRADPGDARPCWGAPGVAIVAQELGLRAHPSIADSRALLTQPPGQEPGSLCCGTAGRALAGRRLGLDVLSREKLLADQAERVVGAPGVPSDAWVPGLRYGVAGSLLALVALSDSELVANPLLADYRRPQDRKKGH